LGEPNPLLDQLITYQGLSPYAKVRQSKWSEMVHRPIADEALAAIRRSTATGLPYGEGAWIKRLAKKLDLDLTIRPRGRPRKQATAAK
jgi:putative transposase